MKRLAGSLILFGLLGLMPALAQIQGGGVVTINLGTAPVSQANPFPVTCSTCGGGSSGGSVTAAGTNGTLAQAIQGILGGVPVATLSEYPIAPPTSTTGDNGTIVMGVIRAPSNGGNTAGNQLALPIDVGGKVPTGLYNSLGINALTSAAPANTNSSATGIEMVGTHFEPPTEIAAGTPSVEQIDPFGVQLVNTEGGSPSFVYSFNIVPPTGNGAVFLQYCGEAASAPVLGITKIHYITVQPIGATTAGTAAINVSRYSTAASGGTSSAVTPAVQDGVVTLTNTSVMSAYTVAPTAGTLTSVQALQSISVPVAATITPPAVIYQASSAMLPLTLRGAASCIAISNTFATAVGVSYNVSIGVSIW